MKILVLAIISALQCASATITLKCNYTLHGWKSVTELYSCTSKVVRTGRTSNVVGVSQNHLAGRSNQNVKGLLMYNQPIISIPKDINLHFENLEGIRIELCPMLFLTSADLEPFPKMRHLAIVDGELRSINGNVFKHLPQLELLDLTNNRITNVGTGIFNFNPKLHIVDFDKNLCSRVQAYYSVANVAAAARELALKCPPTDEMIAQLNLDSFTTRRS